jgi:hypothetical protein
MLVIAEIYAANGMNASSLDLANLEFYSILILSGVAAWIFGMLAWIIHKDKEWKRKHGHQ